jgi:DNA-binding GntR family transcriptional regulator
MNPTDSPAWGDPRSTRPPGATHLYQELREQILELHLRPGQELDEGVLAQRFRRSRTAVREALLNLSNERLVELLPNRGARVAHFDFLQLPRFIEAIDLVSRAINRYAAERRSAEQLMRIKATHERFAECMRDGTPTAISADNRQFHMAVAEAADNAYLHGAYRQLHQEGMRVMHLALGRARSDEQQQSRHLERVFEDHEALVTAIEARDADAAEAVARSHTAIFRERIAEYLSQSWATEIGIDPATAFTSSPAERGTF